MKVSMMIYMIIVMALTILSGVAHAKSDQNWTGFYGGLNSGVIFNDASLSANNLGFTRPDGTCDTSLSFSSFFSGLQFGYAYQFSTIVLGLEADYNYNFNKEGKAACTCDVTPGVSDRFTISNPQQRSLRGRIGYKFYERLLPFVMVGGSLADVGMKYRNEGGDYYSKDTSTFGWLVGVGFEWRLTSAWSLRTEYSYTFYNNALKMGIPVTYDLYDPNGNARFNLHANTISVGFNYWL